MSEYKYGYEKLMAENDLQMSDLTDDARNSITAIKDLEKSIRMAQGKGKEASETTLSKIRTSDKMATQEIVDMLDDDDDDDDNDDNDDSDNNDDLDDSDDKNEPETVVTNDPKGLKIDAELEVVFASGKKEIGFDELKSISRTAYEVIFQNYDNSGDNGIETSKFTLIETDDNLFTLTKK
jgi:hypothetical protein